MEHLEDQCLDMLAEGRLALDEARRAREHLAVCASCRHRFRAWQEIMEGLDELEHARGSWGWNRICQYRIQQKIRRHSRESMPGFGQVPDRRGPSLVYGAVVGLLMGICLAHLSTPLLDTVDQNVTTASWHLAMDDVNLLTYGGGDQ